MRAIVQTAALPIEHPEALIDVELADPTPGTRDLLVRVEAVSVNPVDTKLRAGVTPDAPRVLGWDAVGTVEALGSDVEVNARAIVNYHRRTADRQVYGIDLDGVGHLSSPEHVATEVELHDMRDHPSGTSFSDDGIAFVSAPTTLSPEADGMEDYEAELRDLLIRELGAEEVHVFDHTVRVDDPSAARRPARNVHTDYSPEGARARLRTLLGDDAEAWQAGHYAFVNVWRPVCPVVRSAPLAFVRPRSVEPEDWVTLDLVYPDRVGQILGLVPGPDHEWVYWSEMTADDVVLFNIHDNRGRPAVAHSAVDLVEPDAHPSVRRSLESRTVVRFPSRC